MYIDKFHIPEEIVKFINNKPYHTDAVGRSQSAVILFEEYVLKIEKISVESENELKLMQWLQGRLPVPKIIEHCQKDEYNFLLMTKLRGQMLYQVNNSIEIYVEALNQLKEVDYSGCPVDNRLKHYLRQAEYNVVNGYVDVDDANPDTYGPNGFKDPQDLLKWLKDNQPVEELCFTHGDLCMPNILVENDTITGFIDLGRGGISNRYRDISLCYRSYLYNTDTNENEFKEKFERFLNVKLDMDKIRYYILIDELF